MPELLKKHLLLFILFSILFVPNLYLLVSTGNFGYKNETPLIDIILLIFIISTHNVIGKAIFSLCFTSLYFIKVTSILYYKSTLSYSAFSSIFETTLHETSGYFSHFGFSYVIIAFLISALYCYAIFKNKLQLSFIKRTSLLISILLVFPLKIQFSPDSRKKVDFLSEPYLILNSHYKTSLLNPIFNLLMYKEEQKIMKADFNFCLPQHIKIGENSNYNHIYLVIGESSNKEHYSIYGYPYQTTPLLSNLMHNENFLLIENAIASAPITRESLKRVLSFATSENGSDYSHYINLINAAKMKGFETIWLSSQAKSGLHDSIIGRIGSGADKSLFSISDDDKLFPYLLDEYHPNKKQLFVLHFTGSHMPYSNFDHQDLLKLKAEGSLFPEYDATIAKTDRLLHQVMKLTEKDNKSLVIYLSDHGEEIGLGHGLNYMSKSQYEVPMFIFSPNRQPNENLIKELSGQNHFNTQYVMEYICDSFGFEIVTNKMISSSKERVIDAEQKVRDYIF